MIRTALFLFVLSLGMPSCSAEPQGPDLSRETYIDVMVKLRLAQTPGVTPAEFESKRAEILREAGVTDSMLVQWSRVWGGDAAMFAELWDSINARLVAAQDSAT